MTAPLLQVAVALVLVLVNGFFVATEFAIVKIRATRLKTLLEEGEPAARHALVMVQRMDKTLSASQFGVTLASLGLGWIGEPAFAELFEQLLLPWAPAFGGAWLTRGVAHSIALAVSFAVITFLHIVVGELAPKGLAIQRAEKTTLRTALPMRVFYALFYPAVWILNFTAARVLRLLGLGSVGSTSPQEETHSEEELRMILASATAAGAIGGERADLLERVLAMVEKTARQILVPRSQVRSLDLEESLEKNIADARVGGHTWLPVCRGSLDQIEGMVNVKDLFFLLSRGELRSLSQLQRPVLFVPENVTLEQLLSEFRRRRRQLAVVVDEHGGTSGIVTLADVVAELVGDIAALGRRQDEVKSLPGGRLELPGTAPLDDLEERLDVQFDLPEDADVTTLGGYLMARLGRVPEPGDRAEVGEFIVRVLDMDGPRVQKVRIEPLTAPAASRPPPTQSGPT